MKLLLIDNYDSFTFNLYHYFEELTAEIDVIRNDALNFDAVKSYNAFVISPGPGLPDEAGLTVPLIKRYYKTKKILGVCLGHQALAVALGGRLKNLNTVMHGISRSVIIKKNEGIYKDLPPQFEGGRYHSWVVDKGSLPHGFDITAVDTHGHIMSLKHKKYDLTGVQYHPESIMTAYGKTLLKNWLRT